MPKLDLHSLARLGAYQRYQELKAEIASLLKSFPDLESKVERFVKKYGTRVLPRARKRRKMSAAARAKISAAQKARWAKQKANK
jgi:hypothetical protein